MLFLVFNNVNFQFGIKKLIQRSYITTKTLFITSQIEIINKRKFAKIVLHKNFKTFIVYIAVLEVEALIY